MDRMARRGGRQVRVFLLLAATQIFGWGAAGLTAVLAGSIAADLGAGLPGIFLGTSLFFLVMGLAAPLAGRGIRACGARRMMAAGAALMGGGLFVAGAAPHLPVYLLGWGVAGAGGAMFLTTSAYVYLRNFAGTQARSLIGTLMLVTVLAGSVFWPATVFLAQSLGWRGVVFLFAAGLSLVAAPALLAGLPEPDGAEPADAATAERPAPAPPDRGVFRTIVLAIALTSFVTFGIESAGIVLLQDLGTDPHRAVAIASLLGIAKLAGRGLDLAGGRSWDGLATARWSVVAIPAGLAALIAGGPDPWALALFVGLYGIGSGAFAVARATLPLVFSDGQGYGAAMSAIALPMNLTNALAPTLLAALLSKAGAAAVLALLLALSCGALVLVFRLERPREVPRP